MKFSCFEKPNRFNICPREGHVAVVWNDYMYVYGGVDSHEMDEIVRFDFTKKVWDKVVPKSENKPNARERPSANVYRNQMIIFGGFSSNRIPNNDIWIFDFVEETWTKVTCDPKPQTRYSHSAEIFDDKLIIFGGWDRVNFYYLNDVHEFDLITMKWKKWECKGQIPAERYGHATFLYQNNLYIVGGYGYSTPVMEQLCALNLITKTWTTISTKPVDFYNASAFVHNHCMYIYGGYSSMSGFSDIMREYNFSSNQWEYKKLEDNVLGKRGYYSIVLYKNAVYLFGGSIATEKTQITTNDFFRCELKPYTYEKLFFNLKNNSFTDILLVYNS